MPSPSREPRPADDIRIAHAVTIAVERTAVIDDQVLVAREDIRPGRGIEHETDIGGVPFEQVPHQLVSAGRGQENSGAAGP